MKFFVDSADITAIRELNETGMVDGITTNPSLLARHADGLDVQTILRQICALVAGPVSAEVTAVETEAMLREAEILKNLAPNICIKLPMTWDGIKACRSLSRQGVDVNMTLVFSASQALLAAKAGARFVSPFIGRLDDIGHDGLALIEEIATIYRHYPAFSTEILVASARVPGHIIGAAKLGADVVTMPPVLLQRLIDHPLTENGLAAFLEDWRKAELTL